MPDHSRNGRWDVMFRVVTPIALACASFATGAYLNLASVVRDVDKRLSATERAIARLELVASSTERLLAVLERRVEESRRSRDPQWMLDVKTILETIDSRLTSLEEKIR